MINPPCYYGNLVVRCTGKKRKEKEARNEAGERAWRVNRGYLRRHEFEKVGSVKYEGSIQLKINLTDDPSNPRIARRREQHGARFPVVHLRVRARFCRMARAWWSINGRLHKSPARWFTTNNSRDTRVRACVRYAIFRLIQPRRRRPFHRKSIDHLSNIYADFLHIRGRSILIFIPKIVRICSLSRLLGRLIISPIFKILGSRLHRSWAEEILASANVPLPFFLQSIAVKPVSRIIHSCLPRIAYTSLVTDANLSNSPRQVFTEVGEERRFEDVNPKSIDGRG